MQQSIQMFFRSKDFCKSSVDPEVTLQFNFVQDTHTHQKSVVGITAKVALFYLSKESSDDEILQFAEAW